MDNLIWKLIDFITVMELSQAVLLIFILLVMKKNKKANVFFAAFMLILSLNFFSMFFYETGFKTISYIFAVISIPGIALTGVFIYFYTMFMTGLMESLKPRHLVHSIVYIFCLCLFLLITGINNLDNESKEIRNTFFAVLSAGFINSLVYIYYTMRILKRYYNNIENYYSDLERMNLNWLKLITSLSFLALFIWCISFWFCHFEMFPKSEMTISLDILMLIAIIFITAYYIINQPEIFRQNLEMNHEIEEAESPAGTEKYARQSIDENMQDEYLAKLEAYMEEKKPYLDENITIKDLSDDIGIPSHHLSIAINNRLGKNFYTFINEYRIREALSILDDPVNLDASIIAVAFRAGFNSKSTFNSVFKKITGKTPTEYRSASPSESGLAS